MPSAMPSRRDLMLAASLSLLARPLAAAPSAIQNGFRDIESRVGGRLGVSALDTASDRRVDYHSDKLWPLCSTFKFLLVGAVLAKVDTGHEQLDRDIAFTASDLLDYAPVVKARLPGGKMTIAELCEAAITLSDNSAANLLLQTVGGPGGLTIYARSLGDRTTHLDRIEPYLNEAMPGDARDSSSPAAMVNDLGVLLLQDALTPASRQRLTDWLIASQTGRNRLRAGLPAGWRVGDKTGSGARGSTNDIAIAWPPGRQPILIAAYLTGSDAPEPDRSAALAEVARVVAGELTRIS